MKIGFLWRGGNGPARLFSEIAREHGHEVVCMQLEGFDIEKVEQYAEDVSEKIDIAVYFVNFLGYSERLFLEHLCKNIPVLNAEARLRGYDIKNKAFQLDHLLKLDSSVKIPRTYLTTRGGFKVAGYQYWANIFSTPFVVKSTAGFGGKNVWLVEEQDDYEKLFDIERFSGELLIQEYIPHEYDVRVMVFGDNVSTVFKRVKAEGEYRANLSQGGTREMDLNNELRDKLSDLSIKITKHFALDISGLDFILHEGVVYFIEVNTFPIWPGTKKESAEALLSLVEEASVRNLDDYSVKTL